MTSNTNPSPDWTALAGSWSLDLARTSVTFQTKAMWVLKVKGTMKATSGGGTVGPDGALTGTLLLDPASIDTKNNKRDNHLRTSDFFEVDKYPIMTFTATGARPAADGKVQVDGELTIHGQTRPLTVNAEVAATGDTATAIAEVDIDRSAWGMTWAKMGAGLANHVVVNATFVKA